eukprot:Skav221780  [mRNA]  locus=scaffold2426:304320:310665:- [translate_table: standard]
MDWHVSPKADWLVKCDSLLFDLLNIAPNTKVQSVRLQKEEWEKSESMGPGRVQRQRQLVNQAISHDDHGKLILTLNKPIFKKLETTYNDTKSKEKEKSLPKVLLMGKFNLSPEMFASCLEDGTIREVKTKSGAVQYTWSQAEHQVVRGKKNEQECKDENQITAQQKKGVLGSMKGWNIGLFAPLSDLASTSASSSVGRKPLALENGISDAQWQMAQKQLNTAMGAWDKLVSSAKKKLQMVGVDAKEDPVWQSLKLVLFLD